MGRGFAIVSAYAGGDLTLPVRKTACSAGYDLAAATAVILTAGKVTLVPTGMKAYMESDEYLGLHIRSSIAIKYGLQLINGQGIIDADYYDNQDNEGHIMIAIYNPGAKAIEFEKGIRIAQGIFYKYLLADVEPQQKTRQTRSGGLGSTGEK